MEEKSSVNDLINRTLVNLQMVGNIIGTWPLSNKKLNRFFHFILHFNHQCAITFFCVIDTCGPFVSAKHCDPSVQVITDELSARFMWQFSKV
jgi:hypothetical protein